AWSGLLLAPAGVAMIACAALTLRGGTPDRRAAEWRGRLARGVIAVALALMWVVVPVGVAMFAAGKPRSDVPAGALGLAHQDVRFSSTDGLRLSGGDLPP